MGEELTDAEVFAVVTPLGVTVRLTKSRWGKIVQIKHPVMAGKEAWVKVALQTPRQVRRAGGTLPRTFTMPPNGGRPIKWLSSSST